MKKFLVATIAIAALTAPAIAGGPSIPAEFRGLWCATGDHPYLTQRSKIPASECDAEINLTATLMQSDEGPDCKLTEIKTVLVDRVNLPEGAFTCPFKHSSETYLIRFTFTTGSGSMGYKARRLYLKQQD